MPTRLPDVDRDDPEDQRDDYRTDLTAVTGTADPTTHQRYHQLAAWFGHDPTAFYRLVLAFVREWFSPEMRRRLRDGLEELVRGDERGKRGR